MRETAAPSGSANFIERLRLPAAYPHPAKDVQLLETHISWVLLAGPFAYKIKKPVSLGFADFSTLESRRFFCEEELRLNRRTAPALYVDVVPVAGTPAAPVLGGQGEAFDYAVRMHRFSQEALLDRMARAGELAADHVEALARRVAAFHGGVARAGLDGPLGASESIRADAVDNFTQPELLDQAGDTREQRKALCAWTLHEFNRLERAFQRRKHDGFVRECHGDLHLRNVVMLEGEPVPFDAIEFNEALRWVDVMNEVAFPLMDLCHHGLPRLANRFVDTYLEATGDRAGLQVLRFYAVYRAMVRAKVACIRAHQARAAAQERERAEQSYRGHLDLAQRLSRAPVPALIVMHGLSGSGKSTVSQELVDGLGAVRIRSDVERKRLHGLAADAKTGARPGEGIYTPDAEQLTYGRLAALAGGILDAGYPVIVDAAFLKATWRELFREFARDRGAPFVLVACAATEAALRERVERRSREGRDASEAGLAVLAHQIATMEPLGMDELETAVLVDTATDGPPRALKALARRLDMASV